MAKVLVCDDDKEIVEAIDIYLTQEGYEVFKAYDGQEALEVLTEGVGGSSGDRCDDAPAGRDPGYAEDPGGEQHPDHHPVGQVRGCGQDPGAQCRSGRLCDEAL